MKTDLYTKTILTVIALCLTVIVLKDIQIIPTAYASDKTVVDTRESDTEYRLVPISNMETLDVRIVDINTYDELNVNVKSIDTYDEMKVNINNIDTQDELDINIDEIGGNWISSGGPIPVKIN